jgi:hypothetical protein
MGNRISDDALSLIAQFDVITPKRFLEVWNTISPRIARKLWRHPFIRAWNMDVPFPNMYAFFSTRIGCESCGHLMYCPLPDICFGCDSSGGAYEKKTHLQSRYGLQPHDFRDMQAMPDMFWMEHGFRRGLYYSIEEAFLKAFARRQMDWRTWYQDLKRRDVIRAKTQKTRDLRKAEKQAKTDYISGCEKALQNIVWQAIKTHYHRNTTSDLRVLLGQIASVATELGLTMDLVMISISALPIEEADLFRVLYTSCQCRFFLQYCPFLAAQEVLMQQQMPAPPSLLDIQRLALKSSALGFLPYDFPWRRQITPLEWQMRETALQENWSLEQKTDFMLALTQEPAQNLAMEWQP